MFVLTSLVKNLKLITSIAFLNIFILLVSNIEFASASDNTLNFKKIIFNYPATVEIPAIGCTEIPLKINAEAAGVVDWTLAVFIPDAKQTNSVRMLDFPPSVIATLVKIQFLQSTYKILVCRENNLEATSDGDPPFRNFGVSPGSYRLILSDSYMYNQNRPGLEYVIGDLTFVAADKKQNSPINSEPSNSKNALLLSLLVKVEQTRILVEAETVKATQTIALLQKMLSRVSQAISALQSSKF